MVLKYKRSMVLVLVPAIILLTVIPEELPRIGAGLLKCLDCLTGNVSSSHDGILESYLKDRQ